jgi:hypothetical protein
MLQQPYGAIAQLPGWGAAFVATGSHTVLNVFEWLKSPGQFYFDKSTGTLYYYPRAGDDMSTADVEVPVAEQLIVMAGTSTTIRVKNITIQGITFANTANTVWFAPAGTSTFVEGATMTKAAGNATSIAVPTTAGIYKLFVVDAQGKKLGESDSLLRVGN